RGGGSGDPRSAEGARLYRGPLGRRDLPPEGPARAPARIGGDPAAAARRVRERARAAEVRGDLVAGAVRAGGGRAESAVSGAASAGPGGAGCVRARADRRNGERRRLPSDGAGAARAHARRGAVCAAARAGVGAAAWSGG